MVITAAGLALAWNWLEQVPTRFVEVLARSVVIRRAPADMLIPDMAGFLETSIDSAWLVAGWLRFPAPDWWFWIVRLLTLAGLSGAAMWWLRGSLRQPLSFAWMFALAYALPLLVVAFVLVSVPQGRYLFGAFVPFAALIVAGLMWWFPDRLRSGIAVAVVTLVAVLDAAGFATVLIPAYWS
jgi:hypothetical protein